MKKKIGLIIGLCLLISASAACAEGMKFKAFEKKVIEFSDRVLDGQNYDFVAAKATLIEDLYRTNYMADFEAKYDLLVRYSRSLSFDIEKVLAGCKNEKQFTAAMDRYAEWKDFCVMADHAPEDMQKEMIQEYLMDKKREGKPPFEIKSAKWEPENETNEDLDTYKKELGKAEAVLKKALSALKNKNEDDFAKLFPEKMQLLRKAEPEYSEINQLYKAELQENWQAGMTTDIAPLFIRADLQDAANQYKKEKVVKTVMRRWQDGKAKVGAVYMEKENGKYIIKIWEKGSFDMKNRRR